MERALVASADRGKRSAATPVQHRAVLGLTLLLVIVLPLGALAMAGVGLGWFKPSFAVLAITLRPSFTGWLLVLRRAFRSDRRS